MEKFKYNVAFNFTTLFGIGRIKGAPGTYGSIAALPVLFISPFYYMSVLLLLIVVVGLISLPFIKIMESKLGDDPSSVIIDEVVGMWITICTPWVDLNLIWVITAFALFRLFDIMKPFPINRINDKKGAFFVMLDDVIAGILAWLCLHIFYSAYKIFPYVALWFQAE